MANDMFYLWGPPGTGKTQTISAAAKQLLSNGKRILVCSNTNRAVDQVLLKLCEQFGAKNETLVEGHIIRVGAISDNKLSDKWSKYITIEGVIKRKSADYINRRSFLETELEKVNKVIAPLQEILKALKSLEKKKNEELHTQNEKTKLESDIQTCVTSRKKLEIDEKVLQEERIKRYNAGTIKRAFMRSKEKIEQDLKYKQAALKKITLQVQQIMELQKQNQIILARLKDEINTFKKAVGNSTITI